jgi:hypothetical protein
MSDTSFSRYARAASIASLLLLLAAWLRSATGAAVTPTLSRGLLALAAAAATTYVVAAGLALLRERDLDRRNQRLEILLFAATSCVVYWLGIGHEVGGYYYWDEGIYAKRASQINGGELLVPNFIYPHLLFYIEAFVQWLANLAPPALAERLTELTSVHLWPVFHRLLYRLVVATFGALTVVPVYGAARNVAGRGAARLAATAVIFSPVYLFGAKLNTCDVPAAFFVALCLLYLSRLATEESTRSYVLAGVAAGLAAGTKYPAGFVAFGIVGIWLWWRWHERRLRPGLLWAGLTSVITLLATTPALLRFPQQALNSQKGIFFGVNQYSNQGWVGVIVDSNLLYYLGLAVRNFGAVALVASLLGCLLLAPDVRRRLLLLVPFPAAFLLLLTTNSMVVERNIYPLVPAFAIFIGVGLDALLREVRSRAGALGLAAPAALVVIAFAQPVAGTLLYDAALLRPSTRDLATDWFKGRLPPGAAVYKERYTPNVDRGRYRVMERRFAPRMPFDDLLRHWDYLVLADRSFQRWFEPNVAGVEHHDTFQDWYRRAFDELEREVRFEPGRLRLGPLVEVYRIHAAEQPEHYDRRTFDASEIFRPRHKRAKPGGAVRFRHGPGWGVVRGDFAPGRYRLTLRGKLEAGARLAVWSSDNEPVAELEIGDTGTQAFDLPRAERYYFQISVGQGSLLNAVEIAPAQ